MNAPTTEYRRIDLDSLKATTAHARYVGVGEYWIYGKCNEENLFFFLTSWFNDRDAVRFYSALPNHILDDSAEWNYDEDNRLWIEDDFLDEVQPLMNSVFDILESNGEPDEVTQLRQYFCFSEGVAK